MLWVDGHYKSFNSFSAGIDIRIWRLKTDPALKGLRSRNPANTGRHPMTFQCWASVEDGGPTLKRHWVMPRACWEISFLCTPPPHRPWPLSLTCVTRSVISVYHDQRFGGFQPLYSVIASSRFAEYRLWAHTHTQDGQPCKGWGPPEVNILNQ